MGREKTDRERVGMSEQQMEAANRARLRRDYRNSTPSERVRQVAELSRVTIAVMESRDR